MSNWYIQQSSHCEVAYYFLFVIASERSERGNLYILTAWMATSAYGLLAMTVGKKGIVE